MRRPILYGLVAGALLCGLFGNAIPAKGLRVGGGAFTAQPAPATAMTAVTAMVKVGQEVLVAVKTNPSTGYRWQVSTAPGIAVSSTDYPTRPFDPKHPVVGSPGICVYRFTAVKVQSAPYVLWLVERAPSGQATGASVVVTISAHG